MTATPVSKTTDCYTEPYLDHEAHSPIYVHTHA